MIRFALLTLFLTLAACSTETRVIDDHSVGAQFGSLNKNGWEVTRNDQPAPQRKPADDNIRVINPATFNLHVSTNFQVDDPSAHSPATQPANRPAAVPLNSWGLPVAPGGGQ